MELKTITILWMDDREETYPRVTVTIRDGVLHLHQYADKTHALTAEWHHPTANIRTWCPDGQAAPSEMA